MKLLKTKIALLMVSGLLLIVVGASIIVSPEQFYSSNSIDLGTNISLLNELKAPAGLLLAAGIFMIIAVFVKSKIDVALSLTTLIFLSYALSRVVSMGLDGVPASGLVWAAGLEAIIGLIALAVWLTSRTPAGKVANV